MPELNSLPVAVTGALPDIVSSPKDEVVAMPVSVIFASPVSVKVPRLGVITLPDGKAVLPIATVV